MSDKSDKVEDDGAEQSGGQLYRRRPKLRDRWSSLRRNPRFGVFAGIFAANALGATLLWILIALGAGTGTILGSIFVLIPLLMGIVGNYFWQGAKLSRAANLLYSLINTVIALTLAYLLFDEGIMCLLMGSPLILLFVWLGTVIGKKLFSLEKNRLNVAVAPLFLVLFVGDSLSPHNFQSQVTDRIVIHASPQRVWQYIIDYPAITTPSNYWLCHLGLPAPIQSTATGHHVGDTRRCIFTNQVAFNERLTVVEPGRQLTFVVTSQPNDPEALNHLTLERGQFLLQDNGDGTTTLIGTSWYRLNVYPAHYYDLWVQDIVRHVHSRVMGQVKRLAERE